MARGIVIRAGALLLAGVIAMTNVMEAHAAVTLSEGWSLQDVAKVAAGDVGEGISKVGYVPREWHKATVPGTVLTSLVNNGVYPEPLYGENNRPNIIPESLCRTSYWYRVETVVPVEFAGGAGGAGKRVWLNFEGINYTAEVWVNGKQAGVVKGAFARGIFDVTDFVKAGERAAIAVKINPPPTPGVPHEHTVAAGTGGNGGALMQDGPTFGCTIGWDWIPAIRDRDMGIWQKVTLSTRGPVRVDDPSVSSELPLPRTDSAELTLITTVRNATDKAVSGTLRGTYERGNFAVPVTLAAGEVREVTVTSAEAAGLRLANPRLWWPNTYGEPNLYKMRVAFEVEGKESDAREVNFGVRKITYHVPAEEKLIPQTQNLTIYVNGVPVMCKGGCWGMDEAMKRISAETLDAKVRFHQLANYTMIRNWVGQSTSEDFYNACDKYGIMVWDEMFQANRSDGPQVGGVPAAGDTPEVLAYRKETIAMYLANVREKVVRYRSHPSIALWCGRNESYPAPAEVAEGLTKLTAELDPARFYQANSGDGRGVQSGGPYSWRPPAAYYSGSRGGVLEAFKTELGSVSIPTLESIKGMMPEKDWYDLNDDWATHDLLSGAQSGNTFPASMSARYGVIAPRDLADFTRKSQMAMYETFRAMYEGRMAKLFNPSAAVLMWMSNPSQPSFVWQIYSYELEPLAALYGSKKGSEPLHIQMNQNDFHVMVINTAPVAKAGLRARVRVFDMDGTQKMEKVMDVAAAACAATDLDTIAWPEGLSTVHFIKLELMDAAGNVVSDNFYWRTTATILPSAVPAEIFGAGGARGPVRIGLPVRGGGAVEDFSLLQTMPTAELQVVANPLTLTSGVLDLSKFKISVTVTNTGKVPALNAHLQLRNAKTGARVLPVFYSDNYISLLPGEKKVVTIEAASKHVGNDGVLIAVDGWNVTVAAKTANGISVGLNKDAFVGPKVVAPSSAPGIVPATTRGTNP